MFRFPCSGARCTLSVATFLLSHWAGAAEIQSIAVAPAGNPVVIAVGEIRPFVATATFTDATTGRLSSATMAAGSNHACVLQVDGFVQCWSLNSSGQLGNFTTSNSSIPVTANAAGQQRFYERL